MKLLSGTVLVCLMLQMAAAVPQEQAKKASIEGAITRSDNGQPVAGAQVTLNLLSTAPASPVAGVGGGGPATTTTPATPPAQIPPTTTDGEGKFAFKDLEPGTYRMTANATGYVRQEYTSRPVSSTVGNGIPIVLISGQAMKYAGIRLVPTGTISGRIIDDTGQPAIGTPVLALQYVYDAQGMKTLRQMGTETVNDRGEFRIYGLTPGRYYVGMGDGPGPLRGPRGGPGQPSGVSYAFNFFPGVSDVRLAAVIEVKSGREAFADMKAVRQQLGAVRGRVTDSTGQMSANTGALRQPTVSISLSYSGFGNTGSYSNENSYNPATGNFEIQHVVPGPYMVQAELRDTTPQTLPMNAANRMAALQMRPTAEAYIVVGNADVENIALTISSPVAVPGRLSVEGQNSTALPSDQIRLLLRRLMNGAIYNSPNPSVVATPNADGTFQAAGLRPGEYALNVFGVPPAYYVKSLQFDNNDILGKSLTFSGSSGSGFNVVLSPKAGQVQGTITDVKMQPVPGVQAVLIPSRRDRADLYKNSAADKDGKYTFMGIPPGDYKIFAWEGMEPYRYFDPDFLKAYETKGQTVHIGESAKMIADVQLIAVPQE